MNPIVRGEMPPAAAPVPGDPGDFLLVVCLCAEWCGSCREYRAIFDRLAAALTLRARFAWVDIEDDAVLLDGVEVDDFPTLLLARGDAPVFFGAVTPHAETLRRLVDTALADSLPALPTASGQAADLAALPGRLRRRLDSARCEAGRPDQRATGA